MYRGLLGILGSLTLVFATLAGVNYSRASHIPEISVTDVTDSSYQTQGCHGPTPVWFLPADGWTRSCAIGGFDIANGNASSNVYVRGYVWTAGEVAAYYPNKMYSTPNVACGTFTDRIEYSVAYYLNTAEGRAGISYHHMDNYHQAVGTAITNPTHVGQEANWGIPVYYCERDTAASTAPHIHAESGGYGGITDTWAFGSTPPNFPYINYKHP